jgi:alkane 1-monooxygenase
MSTIPANSLSQSASRWSWRALKYIMALTVPLTVWISFQGSGVWTFTALLYAFLLLPSLELIMGPNSQNLTEMQKEVVANDRYYDGLLWLLVAIQYGLLIYFIWSLSHGSREFGSLEWWGMVLSMGVICSILGINVGHELGHRTDRFSQFLAKALLVTSLYTHFFIEHNRGHHRNVATPDDPATARKSEWMQTFYFRAVFMAWWSGWKLEAQRLQRKGHSVFHWTNEFIQLQFVQWSLLVAVVYFAGWKVGLAWFVAGMFGGFLLEVVNYIEHYGLQRKKITDNRYERVQPHHSWNSDHVLGRIMLFELTRHSDHHHQPHKPYQLLDSVDHAPQLPTGYPGMMVLCLIPPLFFAIMNPRLERLHSEH